MYNQSQNLTEGSLNVGSIYFAGYITYYNSVCGKQDFSWVLNWELYKKEINFVAWFDFAKCHSETLRLYQPKGLLMG